MDPNNINSNQAQIRPTEPALGDASSYQQRLQEEIARSREEISRRNQGESYSLSSSRTAYEAAKARLERVNQPYGGNYSYEEKDAARKDFQEKEKAFFKANNDHARENYLGGLEARKAEKVKAEAAASEKSRQEAEIQLRASYLARWKVGGGDEKSFNASWEAIKAEHYKKAMFENGNALENSLRAASAGIL